MVKKLSNKHSGRNYKKKNRRRPRPQKNLWRRAFQEVLSLNEFPTVTQNLRGKSSK